MPHVQHGRAAATELHHLAQVAHERGVRLFRAQDGRWLATSHSHEHLAYYVTGLSCECPGWLRHGRCTHHALLLAHLGWLPAIDGGSALNRCPSCTNGQVEAWVAGHLSGSRPCDVCQGSAYLPPMPALAAA